MCWVLRLTIAVQLTPCFALLLAEDLKETDVFSRISERIHGVAAISTHDHLMPFRRIKPIERFYLLGGGAENNPPECALRRIWQATTFSWTHQLTPWPQDGQFETWWLEAKTDSINARATSFYRVMLPAFLDLYGVDFDTISDGEARELNQKLSHNYRDAKWLHQVITERANIELMIIDPSWAPLSFKTESPFAAPACNVGGLLRGFHPSEYSEAQNDPYQLAPGFQIEMASLDDYLNLLDRLLSRAKSAGAVSLKSTLAYRRSLRFENVAKERAEAVFGRPRRDLTSKEIRAFEDFIMWPPRTRLCGGPIWLQLKVSTGRLSLFAGLWLKYCRTR